MVILAMDDEKIALDNLVQSIRKCVPDAEIHGFRKVNEVEFIKDLVKKFDDKSKE